MKENQSHISKSWKNYIIAILAILFVGSLVLQSAIISPYGMGSYESMSNDMSYSKGISASSRSYMPYYNDAGFAPEVEDRQLIKNANLNLEVKEYDFSKSKLATSIKVYEGIILSENEQKYKSDYRVVNYNLKIKADNLDAFLNEAKTLGEVENINVYVNDVTGTYVDYNERLERYQTQIKKYELMLERKDLKIEEEIQIQNRIDQLEEQIFYLKKQIGSLDEKVSYSDVYITLKEKPSVVSEVDFFGLRDGFKLFMDSLEGGLRVILMLIGFLIPFGIVYGIYRLVKRTTKSRK